jgi:ribonuclease HII
VLFDLERRDLFELLDGVDDSKKLSANKRRALVPRILVAAERVALRIASSEEIDAEGLDDANRRVLEEALSAVSGAPCERILVDFVHLPNLPVESITRGDSTSLATAAASVIAKEMRDQLMQALHRQHPAYGFARHAGYGSAAHLKALHEHGPCPAHRRSSRRVAALLA